MTREDIILLSQLAGFNWPDISRSTIEERLERFAALVAAHEREACAKVCERLPAQQDIDVRDQCAAAIRERGKNANRKTNPEIRWFEDNEYNTE